MLRSKFALIGFVATAAVAIGFPAHSQQRMTTTPQPAAAPTPPRAAPARSSTQQNKSFNPTEQQKMEAAGKERAAKEAARDMKATSQESSKGLKAKKEDQLSKSADAESKKLGMKEKICRQQCSKQTGYKPSMKMQGGGFNDAGASVSLGNPASFALYATCVKNNCQ